MPENAKNSSNDGSARSIIWLVALLALITGLIIGFLTGRSFMIPADVASDPTSQETGEASETPPPAAPAPDEVLPPDDVPPPPQGATTTQELGSDEEAQPDPDADLTPPPPPPPPSD